MRYMGSKKKLLDFIFNSISDVIKNEKIDENYIFADLFAGTGVVGSLFKEKGYKVISNDLQYYSYIRCKHLIENINNDKLKEATYYVNYLNNLPFRSDGFIYNNYCLGSGSERNYFSDDNGKKCDTIRMEIEDLYCNKKINKNLYYYLLSSLVECVDKDANTTGHYSAFLKKVKHSKPFEFKLLPIVDGVKGKVYNEDICDLIMNIKGDVLYLDPPYNGRQYSSHYHILETIAKYDNPKIGGITGRRDLSKQKSKFSFKSTVEKEFDFLIKNANFKYIFVSYNNEGTLSLDVIKKIMSKYGDYKLYEQEYKRYKSKDSENETKTTKEYLHCLIKK